MDQGKKTHIASTYLDDETQRRFEVWLARHNRTKANAIRLAIQNLINMDVAGAIEEYATIYKKDTI